MRKKHLVVGALFVAILAVGIAGISAVSSDEEVSLQQVPAAVRATIEKYAGQGEIVEIEREVEDGQVVYEAEVIVDGKEMDVLVSATGEFLGTEAEEEDDDDAEEGEDEDEESIQWEQLPKAVQDALSQVLPGVQLDELTREIEDGYVLYEAAYQANGTKYETKLTEEGDIIESEEAIDAASLPPAIQARLQKEFPNAKIEKAELVVSS